MARIVTTHYRYKRPSRKRKAVALEVPAVVKAAEHVSKHPTLRWRSFRPPRRQTARRAQRSRPSSPRASRASDMSTWLTSPPRSRRGDAADALFRTVVRRIRQRP